MTSSSRAWNVVAVVVMLFGVALRFAGCGSLELWSDEARWCEHLLTGTGTWFRPAGYMWLTRAILGITGVDEPALRSLSTLAGLALLPLTWWLLLKIVRRRAVAVAVLWFLAIHPVAVAMSKEFKPYIVEAALHAALLLLALLAAEGAPPDASSSSTTAVPATSTTPDRRRLWLTLLCVTSAVAPFFAWTVVFAYPGIYLALGWPALQQRQWRRVAALGLGCLATLAVLVGIFLARLASKKPASDYWGQKYDVFYIGDSVLEHVGWSLQKTVSLLSFPGHLQMPWHAGLEWVIHTLFAIVAVVGVVQLLAGGQRRLVTLLLLPWVTMLAFNTARAWPYGLFRTNTFMLLYAFVLFAVGLEAIVGVVVPRIRLRRVAALAMLVLLVLTFPFELGAFAHKGPGTLTSESSVRAALERIYAAEEGLPVTAAVDDERFFSRVVRADEVRRAEADVVHLEELPPEAGVTQPLLVLDGHACTSMRHYRDFDAETRPTFEDWIPAHFVTLCIGYGRSEWTRALNALIGRDFWLVSGKTNAAQSTRERLAPLCELDVDQLTMPSTHLVHCRHRPDLTGATRTATRTARKTEPRADREGDSDGDGDGDDDGARSP